MSGENGAVPQVETKVEVKQVRTQIDSNQVTKVILGLASHGFEHYCTTLVPAGIARGSAMGGQFDMLHFFRRVTQRTVDVPKDVTTLPESSKEFGTGS